MYPAFSTQKHLKRLIMADDAYEQYYYRQATGAGLPVFRGVSVQRGHGIGNLLNAAFRAVTPVIKSAGKSILKQGVSTGANILNDVLGGESLKASAKRRAVQGGQTLVNNALSSMVGRAGSRRKRVGLSGQKRRGRKRTGQSSTKRGRRRIGSVRRRKARQSSGRETDIFS